MITVLGEGRDRKGIQVKVTHNQNTNEVNVVVWHEKSEAVRMHSFPANRFSFTLPDLIKANEIAEMYAADIEKELKI